MLILVVLMLTEDIMIGKRELIIITMVDHHLLHLRLLHIISIMIHHLPHLTNHILLVLTQNPTTIHHLHRTLHPNLLYPLILTQN